LEKYTVYLEEAKQVILELIEQAIRDYVNLPYSTNERDQFDYQTAEAFLFDDEYTIQWGDYECSFQQLLDFLDCEAMNYDRLNIDCARRNAIKRRRDKDKRRKYEKR
jgi:hypothetical protein